MKVSVDELVLISTLRSDIKKLIRIYGPSIKNDPTHEALKIFSDAIIYLLDQRIIEIRNRMEFKSGVNLLPKA